MQTFRFVVVYRPETFSTSESAEVWRGWIEQVFPESATDTRRLFFQDPGDVGKMIKTAVGDIPVADASADRDSDDAD